MLSLPGILGIAHWIGFLLIVVGYVLGLRSLVVHPLMVWALRIQLLLGLALVAVAEMNDAVLDHAWVGVKLVVALAAVGLAEVARTRAAKGQNNPMLMHAAFGAALVNFLVAMLWR